MVDDWLTSGTNSDLSATLYAQVSIGHGAAKVPVRDYVTERRTSDVRLHLTFRLVSPATELALMAQLITIQPTPV
jgi:hypothetical protein